jgi:hypothetical protein
MPAAAASPVPAGGDPWGSLLQVGMALLEQFVGAARGPGESRAGAAPAGGGGPSVVRDERTGETYLKVPVPSREVVEGALQALGSLLEGLRRP